MTKRGTYGKWSAEDLQRAMRAYKAGRKGLNACSREYGIPKSTLLRHVRHSNKIAKGTVRAFGRTPTFDCTIEKLLADHVLKFADVNRDVGFSCFIKYFISLLCLLIF